MTANLKTANVISLLLMLSIVGCSILPKPKFDPMDKNSSVVVGYIDTKDMPSELDWVKIQGLGDDNDYVTATADPKNGAFWHIAVRPGFRQISKFGGTASTNLFGHATKANIYKFGAKDDNGITINIKAPGVYFMGSHKFILHKGKDQFETQPIKSPSEKAVLQMVLKGMEERGSHQQYPRQFNMIKKRIAELP